jgi:nucleoid-associated protein YgaU
MEAGFRTPLLDLFRRGEVDREIRLLAAHGAVAPRAPEQIALLMLLAGDPDADIAAAEATIESTSRPVLAALLARGDTPEEMRRFFALRGIDAADGGAVDPEAPLVETAPDPGGDFAGPADAAATDEDAETMSAVSRSQRERQRCSRSNASYAFDCRPLLLAF